MATKPKPNQLPLSSSSSSESASGSEDDEQQISTSESDEVSDSGSDPKQFQEPKKTLLPPPKSINKPQHQPPSSSEDSESGSGDDSESPAKDLDKNDPISKGNPSNYVKPIKGFVQNQKPMLKLVSDSSPAKKRSPANIPASFPAIEKDGKKMKKSDGGDEDVKKQLFQRLFSEEDEIVILEGMIEYKNAANDMGGFYEYVKKMLHVEFSKAQLNDKVRRLRKKYENNFGKEKNGKDRSFSKSHERKGYELSKLIWGGSSGGEGKKNGKGDGASGSGAPKANVGVVDEDVVMMEVENSMDVNRFVRFGGRSDGSVLEEEIVKGGLELLEGSKREEVEAKWKKLKMQELELYAKRMELLQEQVALVIDAVKSSGN